MIKKIAIVAFFSFMMQTDAMDSSLCPLACMPYDVQDLIISFCDYETEEEFIKRTQVKVNPQVILPLDDLVAFSLYVKEMFPESKKDRFSSLSAFTVCTPHGIPFSVIKCFWDYEAKPVVIFFDIEKKEALYSDKLTPVNCSLSALSSSTRTFAFIRKIKYRSSNEQGFNCNYSKQFLTMKNRISQKKRNIEILCTFKVSSVNFNKQGTHIIMHGLDRCKGAPSYQIVPLAMVPLKSKTCNIDHLCQPDNVNKATPFQSYLRERLICKNIEESK